LILHLHAKPMYILTLVMLFNVLRQSAALVRPIIGTKKVTATRFSSNFEQWSAMDEIPPHPRFTHHELSQETLYIMDGTSMIYNAYFSREGMDEFGGYTAALGNNGEMVPCGALLAMSMHFARFIRDIKPRYLVAAMDVSRETFRNEIFPDYKQQRPSAPEDLVPQFGHVQGILEAMGCQTYGAQGYEADDVMATLSSWARERGLQVCIVSGDKDMLQLVGTGVHVMNPRNRVMMGTREVQEKYGVAPRYLCDLMALIGDSADNIPGVRGIGPKAASALVSKFKSIDDLYERLESEVVAAYENDTSFNLQGCIDGSIKKLPESFEKAFELDGFNSRPITTVKKLAGCPRPEIELYRELIRLRSDVPPVLELLEKHESSHLRYIGETPAAEKEILGKLGDAWHKPLSLLRQQYHKLDRLLD